MPNTDDRSVALGRGASRAIDGEAADLARVERFVTALARAVHAFHTYPPGSPSRDDVVEVAREAFRACLADGRESLSIAVTTEGLKFAGERLHGDRGPERGLLRALQRAYVSTLEFAPRVSSRDLRRFCALIAFPDTFLGRVEELPEILAERGVSEIEAHVIPMHRTIEAGTVPEAFLEVVRRRQRSDAVREGTAAEGGWIRLDPSVPLDRVTLGDLPLLLRDAPALAVALQQMTGQSPEGVSPVQAFVSHYQEISELYGALEPEISEALFRRLSDVVRSLPSEAKAALLERSILPGVVDGRRSGRVLQHFSEEEIATALCLLVDMGVGGMEMLRAGLSSLDLPDSRLHSVARSVTEQLELADVAAGEWLLHLAGAGAEDEAGASPEARLSMSHDEDADFAALHAFDLSMDDAATAACSTIADAASSADPVTASLDVALDIARLSADTAVVTGAIRRVRGLFFDLESRGELDVLVGWLAEFAGTARRREARDAEISAIVRDALADYVTPEFIHRVSALPREDDGEPPLVTLLCELGAIGVAALVESLSVESDISARSRLLTALQPRAAELAPDLVGYLSHPEWYVVRNILTLLGHAGAGWEEAAATGIGHPHPRVARESLLALSRIGTADAADRSADALRHETAAVRFHACDALWRFDPALSHPRLLDTLEDSDFVRAYPQLAERLVRDAARRDVPGLEAVLGRLHWNCLRIWDGPRRSLGWTALRELRRRR